MRPLSFSLLTALLAVLFVCSGCSPNIYTNIQKSYPERIEGSTVLVYENPDSLPEAAETLGRIEIKDTGFSIKCNYENVMQRAKNETNKIGGNALLMTWHKKPQAFGSSCHQVAADMLLIPDSTYTDSYFDNIAEQNYQLYENNAGTRSARDKAAAAPQQSGKRKSSTLQISAGYAFITSEFYQPTEVSGNAKQGLDINAVYQWTSKSGIGFGLRYSGYFSSVTYSGTKLKLRLHYAAPEFVVRQEFGQMRQWAFHVSTGIGYMRYTEGVKKHSAGIDGFGFHTDLGIEYKLSPHIALGISAGVYNARFKSMDAVLEQVSRDESAGITRISLNGGLRFYF